MNGYGESLRSLADRLGVRYETTPPAKGPKLRAFLGERIEVLDRLLPYDTLSRNESIHQSLVVGLLCQAGGFPDYADVHTAHTMERFIAALEYECNCPDGENTMRRVICTDRRGRDIVTPNQLARPLLALADETVHAEHAHLPHLLKHLEHCPSFRSGIGAVQLLEGALPAAIHMLVGRPEEAADLILTGDNAV